MRRGLDFSDTTQTGVVLSMLSAVTEIGRFGITAVGDSPDEAQELDEAALRGIGQDAQASLDGREPDSTTPPS